MQNSNHITQRIISTFIEVDDKLTALNKCSSEDFLALNSILKNFYQKAKDIAANANEIFSIFSNKDIYEFESQLSYYSNLYKQLKIDYIQSLDTFDELLNTILDNLNKLFVPLKNFNQNAMTLYFLVTNLKLNVNYLNKKVSESIDTNVIKINQIVLDLKTQITKFDDELLKLKSNVRYLSSRMSLIKESSKRNFDDIQLYIDHGIEILHSKKEEAGIKFHELNQKVENYLISIDKIITNLQYQDIIRQRMEHVQAAHKEIISELSIVDYQANPLQVTKIRDISALQAAQLIHTNRDYQVAIELITSKFSDIDREIGSVVALCCNFAGNINESSEIHLGHIAQRLDEINRLTLRMNDANKEFYNDAKEIYNSAGNLKMFVENISDIQEWLNDYSEETLQQTGFLTNSDNDLNEIVKQITDLIHYINQNSEQIVSYYNESTKCIEQVQSQINVRITENILFAELNNAIKQIDLLKNEIHKKNENINQFIVTINDSGANLSSDLKNTIQQVKYYDFFEKIIEEIIVSLNNNYQELNSLETNETSEMKDNLAEIQKHYTMESERSVHNYIVDSKTEQPEIIGTFNEDDNIELF